MANINRVVLVGNLTRDPELRHTPSGTAVCKLRIAVNDFLLDGGDSFSVLKEATERVGASIDVDALAEYFRTHSPVAPGPQNRIVRTDR